MGSQKRYLYNGLLILIGVGVGFAGVRLTFLVNNFDTFPIFGIIFLLASIVLIASGVRSLISYKPLPKYLIRLRSATLFLLIGIVLMSILFFVGLALSLRGLTF